RDVTELRAFEAVQREMDANYRAVIEATTDAVFVLEREPGAHFRIVSAKEGYEGLISGSGNGIEGKQLDQLVGPQVAAKLREQLAAAIAKGGPVEFDMETAWTEPPMWLAVTLTPIFDEAGFCHRIVATGRDITERRRHEQEQRAAQEAIRRLGEIVESTNDAVVGADSDGNITFWNEAAARMYGYTRDEAL